MADYLTIAIIHILVGFEITTLGFLNMTSADDTVEALMILGFLTFLVAAILAVLMKAGDLAGNVIALILTLVLSLCAATFLIAGSAIWYDKFAPGTASLVEYVMTLDISGGCLGAIGGIFLIVQLASGGGKS